MTSMDLAAPPRRSPAEFWLRLSCSIHRQAFLRARAKEIAAIARRSRALHDACDENLLRGMTGNRAIKREAGKHDAIVAGQLELNIRKAARSGWKFDP